MKRRSFLTGLAALATLLAIPVSLTHAQPTPADDTKLFYRFFKVANDALPNQRQMNWFEDYQNGRQSCKGPRQSGMTTFMLTLALFETKCKGVHIAFFPQNSTMNRFCKERVRIMEDRLGKSVKDGKIGFFSNPDHSRGMFKSKVKAFVMADANRPSESFDPNTYTMDKVFYFGTGETRQYKYT